MTIRRGVAGPQLLGVLAMVTAGSTGCGRTELYGWHGGGSTGGAAGAGKGGANGTGGRGNGGGSAGAGGAAGGSGTGGPSDKWGGRTPQFFSQNLNNDLDLVFMIDNSSGMGSYQNKLIAAFPTFFDLLKGLRAGQPDLHVGIVSSSLGAGAYGDVPGCPTFGDRAAFQNAPRAKNGTCEAVPKDPYLISLDKGTKNNFFMGDIDATMECIAPLGENGCGYEHQLASTARALGANVGAWTGGAPIENAGFLRNDALLAVVLLTNEDDCSAPNDSSMFDTKQDSVSDPLGPLTSYRCNEFGHLCAGVRPPRSPVSNLSDCHSAEDAGKLIRVSDFVTFFKSMKKAPRQVLVATIAGPPEPYTVTMDGASKPEIAPSCIPSTGPGPGFPGGASPGVRLREFTDAFGRDGSFSSICEDSYSRVFDHLFSQVAEHLAAHCIDDLIVDTDLNSDGLQAACDVFDQTTTSSGVVSKPLPNCTSGGTPCWHLVRNEFDCGFSGYEIQVERGGGAAPANTVTGVCCETCTDPSDARCRR